MNDLLDYLLKKYKQHQLEGEEEIEILGDLLIEESAKTDDFTKLIGHTFLIASLILQGYKYK